MFYTVSGFQFVKLSQYLEFINTKYLLGLLTEFMSLI